MTNFVQGQDAYSQPGTRHKVAVFDSYFGGWTHCGLTTVILAADRPKPGLDCKRCFPEVTR